MKRSFFAIQLSAIALAACASGQTLAVGPGDAGDGTPTLLPSDAGTSPACAAAAANKNTIGCDYYAVVPDVYSDLPGTKQDSITRGSGSCFAAFVTNTATTPMRVTIGFKGKEIDANPFAYLPRGTGAATTYEPVPADGIPAGQMAIVFLNQYGFNQTISGNAYIPCPASVTPAITTEDAGTHGTGLGAAIHLTTTAPAVVYDMYPYGGARSFVASATLLIPTSAWDTNYVATAAYSPEPDTGPMDVDVVAMADDTQVQILPTSDIVVGRGVPAGAKNVATTYTLASGQVLHIAQMGDLSGSPIQTNHPVGVWGGHWCMFIPDGTQACDGAHQQIPPIRVLGREYLAVRYANRDPSMAEEIVPWRLMGVVDGTMLTFDPPQKDAPTTLSLGQVVEFDAPGPFHVHSQDDAHPFYFAGHMTGGDSNSLENGDPETVNVIPTAQFLSSYTFFADVTYANTNLVLVRAPTASGAYADVTLDCVHGPVPGWKPIGSSPFQYTRVDLQNNGSPVAGCDNGLHTITSAAPFGLTVWGFDLDVSYAYPAGMSVQPINDVVVPASPR